jgi:peroxiredoxin
MGSLIVGLVVAVAAPATAAGDPVPNFTLTLLDGRTVALADFRGHPLLINFWNSG